MLRPDRAGFTAGSTACRVHPVALYLVLERGVSGGRRFGHAQGAGRPAFPWLEPPASVGVTTVVDAPAAMDRSPSAYAEVVTYWADDAWQAWSQQHAAIAEFVNRRSI